MHLLQRIPCCKINRLNFLDECILCEVTFDKLKGYITVLYRSPSQNSSEFDNFLSEFENMINLINSCKPEWQYDVTSSEGTKIDALISYHGLHQLISQPLIY